ncbi:MAG: hypothetical protein JO165_08620 [Candidatus Eremiobacteraeota bacterium]|nr:hypothetical protein [Candidatus Eremiobacteraeota bacterium]
MHNKYFAALAIAGGLFMFASQPAGAIPIFAQRYHLECGACHSVLPELNEFGKSFRAQGYRLPLPQHGTTLFAIRYQMEWDRDISNDQRRFQGGGVVLSDGQLGQVNAFVHYNLGAAGGPSALYLGFLTYRNDHSGTLYRAGLQELPLMQSPGQRLDDLTGYGYYSTRVELNDLTLAAPRWGLHAERDIHSLHAAANVSFDSYAGSAYGGKPIATGEFGSFAAPEWFLSLSDGNARTFAGFNALFGTRHLTVAGIHTFDDGYRRLGAFGTIRRGKAELSGEQWWGNDNNGDGLGDGVFSSGGYLRLKYYPTRHSYLGIRFDAQATPVITRDVLYYGALHVTPHARLIVQLRKPQGQSSALGAAITVGFPWPSNL